jgi:hypothetical protein
MKKHVISLSLLALSGIMSAQTFNPPGSNPSTAVFRKGLTGFGMAVPPTVHMVEIQTSVSNDGISITQLGGGTSLVKLNNASPGGFNWSLNSNSNSSNPSGGHFSINNLSNTLTAVPFMIHGNSGNVGINTLAPNAKLEVVEPVGTMAGFFNMTASSFGNYTGLKALASTTQFSPTLIGVEGEAKNNFNINGSGSGLTYGVKGSAYGSAFNYAGHFTATSTLGVNYGVYAQVANSGTASVNWAGWFQGNVNINGLAYCTNSVWSSDERFKKNIQQLESVTDKLLKVKGYSYEYNTEAFKDKNFQTGSQIGFIAQELKEVFPELVTEGKDGYNYVNYIGMIPVLLEAIKTQQKQINELQNKQQNTTGLIQNVNGLESFRMEQNEPNPFTNETTVKYNLPEEINKAHLAVYDLSGKQIATFPLAQKGSSSITITSEKLAAGIYIYSVIADGKMVDSKRMIVTEK